MTRKELVGKLRALEKNRQDLSNDTELLEECRKLGLKDLDTTKPGLIADLLENTSEIVPETEKADEFGSRQPNGAELRELVKIFETSKEKSEAECVAMAKKNPLLKGVRVRETIKRQIELTRAAQAKNITPEDVKRTVKKTLLTEATLRDCGIPTDRAVSLAEKIIDISKNSKTLNDGQKKIIKALDEAGLDDKTRGVVIRAVVKETSENLVREKVAEVAPSGVKPETIRKLTEQVTEIIGKQGVTLSGGRKEVIEALEKAGLEKDSEAGREITRQAEKAVVQKIIAEATEKIRGVTVIEPNKAEEIATTAVKIIENEDVGLEDGRKEMERALRKAGIKHNVELGTYIIEKIVEVPIAEKATEKVVDEAVGELINELTDLKPTGEQVLNIERAVRSRIEIRLNDPTRDLDEYKADTTIKEGVTIVKTGDNLSNEITRIMGPRAAGEKTKIGLMVNGVQKLIDKKMFMTKTFNRDSPIDLIRKAKLEEEIYAKMATTGSQPKEAWEAAKTFGKLIFPKNESSTSAAEAGAMTTLRQNNFLSGDNPRVAGEALMLQRIIKSPMKIKESVNKILNVGNKLDGIKYFDHLKKVARALNLTENSHLIKSLQLIQNVVKFQEKINIFTGWISNPIGYFLKIPAVQEFGIQLATRFGGEVVGAMATQISRFGFEAGAKNIIGQLLSTGTVTAVKAGAGAVVKGATTLAADAAVDVTVDAGVAATGVGVPIALILLVLQIGWELIKPVLKWMGKKLEDTLDVIGVGSAETKKFLQENFGKFFGSVMYWGGMAAMFLLAIPMAIGAGSLALIGMVVPGVIGGLTLMQVTTAQTVSSLVPPKGMGEDNGCLQIGTSGVPGESSTSPDGTLVIFTDSSGIIWQCTNTPNNQPGIGIPNPNPLPGDPNPNPNTPGLPGEVVAGECSVSHAVVLTKQCDSQWGGKQLSGNLCSNGSPGTICNSGCGPTSASMLLRRISGGYTPDTVIFGQGYPFSGSYLGIGCDGSDTNQAYNALSSVFGSKVQYASGCNPTSIAGWICAGKVVFVLANFYRNSNLDLGGHFILAQAVSGGKIISADPYYPTSTPFDGTVAVGYIHDIMNCLTIDVGLNP